MGSTRTLGTSPQLPRPMIIILIGFMTGPRNGNAPKVANV